MGYETPEDEWRAILTGQHEGMLKLRATFRGLPSSPRCKLCYAPFKGVGGLALGHWFGSWERNPQLCKNCMKHLTRQGVGGAEVEISMMFADIRGSTGLGERLKPAEFTALLNAFYRLAVDSIIDNDGVVDKFVGDETIGLFIPAYSGLDHARKAVERGSRPARTRRQAGRIERGSDPRRGRRPHGCCLRGHRRIE